MKKILLIFLLCLSMFLVGCGNRAEMISEIEVFEELFTDAIKYDIRSESSCEEGHIPDFMCVGAKDNDTLIHNLEIIATEKSQKIILIGEEEDVLYIFSELSKKGYKNLYYFDGGYEGYANKKGSSFIPETGCGC